MSSKLLTVGLMLAALCGILLPQNSGAVEWTISPFRAQIAAVQSEAETAPDTVAPEALPAAQKKNIGRGVMFSLVIPGAGQLYSGSWLRAVPWFVLEVAAWATYAHFHGQGRDKTDEFEAFAGWRDTPNNFDHRAYLYAEYSVAHNRGSSAGVKYNGTFDNWMTTPWESVGSDSGRSAWLPPPFTHDVLDDDRQQFFEMIGKYLLQFGWGWLDTRSNGGPWPSEPSLNDWTRPSAGNEADDVATVAFDGTSMMFEHYADMRGEANDLLDKGNLAMEVVLVNHVLSALDAAFAVRRYNKRLAESSPLGDLELRYDARPIGGETARFLTVSLPLR